MRLRVAGDLDRRILVVPDDIAYQRPINRFHEIWYLRPHVMRGQVGPYPSVAAEYALKRTLHASTVLHYWPAATLSTRGYQDVYRWQQLAQAWARYTRREIPISVREQ